MGGIMALSKYPAILADIKAQTDLISAIQSQTDLIPPDISTQLDTNLPAVKNKTDLIPPDISTQLDTNLPAVKTITDTLHQVCIQPADTIQNYNDSEAATQNSAYTKVHTFTLATPFNGNIRISFDLRSYGSGTVYGKLYKNGAVWGIEETVTGQVM